MTAAEVEERVRGILVDVFALDPATVGAETSADTVEAWDSLQHLTVVLSIEEEFDVLLTDAETVEVVSFELIVAVVADKLGLPEPG